MINVIGLGVTDKAHLSAQALSALNSAELVIGSERQLRVIAEQVADIEQQEQQLLPPLKELLSLIEQYQGKSIVMLASGDPLHYGIGRWLVKHFGLESLTFHPAISSMQAACHLLGKSLQDVEVLSLHGRPLSKIRRILKNNKTLVILTDKNSQPDNIAQACVDAGFSQSRISVIEMIGYPEQKLRTFTAEQLVNNANIDFDPLHVSVVEVSGSGGILPEFPGFEDQLFITGAEPGKGMITKREVRLAILSLLQPSHSDVIWDIGAGCGSVSVELAYWQAEAKIYALEHHQQRLACLRDNSEKFGVTENLSIVDGRAPEQLSSLPVANKVFIGGSDGELLPILTNAWQQLPDRGILVASAVTENTKFQLQQFADKLSEQQVETLQIAVSKGARLAGQLMYKPNLPVILYKFTKHGE